MTSKLAVGDFICYDMRYKLNHSIDFKTTDPHHKVINYFS